MKIRHWTRAAAIAVVAGVALTACSAGESSSSGGGASSDEPQTLRLSLTAPPSNFQVGNWSGGDATLFMSVYDTILHRAVGGELEPSIAESWEYDDTRTKLTLEIREGMTFTNGEPVDAEAVAASLEAARAGASTKQNFATISGVEATDADTVVVSLSEPDAAIVPSLAGSPGVVGAPDALTAEESKLWPVGSGPYTLAQDKTTVGSEYVLEKNEDYWNADAYPYETVEVQIIQDSAATENALLAGQLDYAGLQSSDATSHFPEDRFTVGQGQPTAVATVWLVDKEGKIIPALKDARVRRAINLAFDRESIAKNLNPGTNTAWNQIFSPVGEVGDEALVDETSYDVEEAKKLLADAGYADGFAVTMPSVTGVTTTYESIIAQSLADIGIEVTWESVPFQEFYAKIFGGNYGMFFMFNGFSGSDAMDLNASNNGIFNPFGYTTPEFEQLEAAANTAPEDEQAEAFSALNDYLVTEAWNAPLTYTKGFYATPKTVEYTPPVSFGQSVLPFQPAGN